MSLNISKNNKLKLLQKKNINISKDKLLEYINFIHNKFLDFSKNVEIKVSKEKILDYSKNHLNPLLWQIGHVVFFYITLCLKNLLDDNIFNTLFNK